MRLVSVNVGAPRAVAWRDDVVETGIFKAPVAGPVRLGRLNLDGDRQADLRVHGGIDKAVYAYPSEHYGFWQTELARSDLSWGAFGENLTVEGLLEDVIRVGDVFTIGNAELEVSQPRLPCFKLGIRFGDPDMLRRFLESGRLGFYLRVRGVGIIPAGDVITPLARDSDAPTIAELGRLRTKERDDVRLLERAVRALALAESWRLDFSARLARLSSR
jgi:MOSC domain-containing protein YiiM